MNKISKKTAVDNHRTYPLLFSVISVIGITLIFATSMLIFTSFNNNAQALLKNSDFSFANVVSSTNNPNIANENNNSSGSGSSNDIPSAKSVFDTGKMVIPSSVKGFIINLPDETHEKETAGRTVSQANAHYLPSNLVIPSGTTIAFVHGDPNHIHTEIVTDNTDNSVVWTTIPIKHPGATDDKNLPPGSYSISDSKYPAMKGTITVDSNTKSSGNLVVGTFFVPTGSLEQYTSEFQSAGFQILSTYGFTSGAIKQKDLSGPTTLIVYSTTMNIDDAKAKLLPMLKLLPYL